MNQELDSRYLDWQLTLEHLKYIHFTGHGFGVLSGGCQPEIFPIPTSRLPNGRWEVLRGSTGGQQRWEDVLDSAANDSSVFTIIEKALRAFSWLKVPTSAFVFKTLLRHYAKQALTHGKFMWNWDTGNYHKRLAALRHYANQTARPLWLLCWRPNFTSTYHGVNACLA